MEKVTSKFPPNSYFCVFQEREEKKKTLLEERQQMELASMKAKKTLSQVLSFTDTDDTDTDALNGDFDTKKIMNSSKSMKS